MNLVMRRTRAVGATAGVVGATMLAGPALADGDYRFLGGSSDASPATLLEVDLSNGSVDPIGGDNVWQGLDITPDGSILYGANDGLWIIDPDDGSAVFQGDLTYQGSLPVLMKSISVSPDGVLFGVSNPLSDPAGVTSLYTIAADGTLDLRGPVTDRVVAIEFADDGTLYGAFSALYILDPTNGSITASLGDLGTTGTAEMDYAPDGTLFGTDPFGKTTSVFSIDPGGTPGSLATPVTDVASDRLLSIVTIPAPGGAVLLALAVLSCGRRRRAR
jgi:hypothetical protein